MDFTKIPEHQVTTVHAEERKLALRRGLWVGLVALLLAGGAVAFWQVRKNARAAEAAATIAAQSRLASRVAQAEARHRELAVAGDVGAEALTALEQAIAAERERQQLGGSSRREEVRHLEELEAQRDVWLARAALPKLAALETTARQQREAGDSAAAVETLRQALALQRGINGSSALARVKDYVRETRLAQELQAAEAEPWQREVRTALARAEAAEAAQQWVEARRAYEQARAAQTTLNQTYPGTRFADTASLKRIERDLASLQAADVAGEVNAHIRRAEEAAAAGRGEEAAAAYAAARAAQEQVNAQFARSRFSSASRAEELEVKRQNAEAAKAIAEVQAGIAAITAALRGREVAAAAERVVTAQALAERIGRDWPRSAGVAANVKLQLAYLRVRRGELAAIQEEALKKLVPLPGSPARAMLATEVSQELYARVMNTNPSRNAGRGLPVDSVSWRDAGEFCERLGWVLGQRVRLPSEAEWLAAIGSSRIVGAWTRESSGGQSREVGKSPATAAGFFDLAGNLAEWLGAEEKAATAPVAGGSFLDSGDTLSGLPVFLLDKNERARHVGFRFVVEQGG